MYKRQRNRIRMAMVSVGDACVTPAFLRRERTSLFAEIVIILIATRDDSG